MNLKNILLDKLYGFYRYRVFPSIRSRRGTTRVLIWIEALRGKSIGKVDEEDVLDPFREDWDNLFILDACRHDLYEEVNGETASRVSLGSNTNEFIERNFSEGDFSDVVYVAANPKFSSQVFSNLTGREPEDVFHEVFHTYREDWDEDNNTCMPENVARDARTARKLFPDKRLVVHFIQPHQPFVEMDYDPGASWTEEGSGFNIWDEGRRGAISDEKIWKYYRKNLELVMPQVENLVEDLDGRTVISSDHGNLVGEMSLYGHPDNSSLEPLRKVPWDLRE